MVDKPSIEAPYGTQLFIKSGEITPFLDSKGFVRCYIGDSELVAIFSSRIVFEEFLKAVRSTPELPSPVEID